MRLQRNYYEVLGLPRTANSQEIKKKYHELARQFHPDRAQDKELAQRLFVQINQAYQTLIDPEKRTRYDNSLTSGNGAIASTRPHSGRMNPVVTAEQIRRWLSEANDSYLRGERDQALKLCHRVLRAEHSNVQAYVLMGDVFADQGKLQEALTAYRTASGLQPANLVLQSKIKRIESTVASKVAASAIASANKPVSRAAAVTDNSARNGRAPLPKHSFFGRLMGKVRSG